MAVFKSDQLQNVAGQTGATVNDSGDIHGRVRAMYFSHTFSTETTSDEVELAEFSQSYANRILGVKYAHTACGFTDVDFGIKGSDDSGTYDRAGTADSTTFFATAADLNTTPVTVPAELVDNAGAFFYRGDKKAKLVAYPQAGTVTNGGVLEGYIEYLAD